MLTSARYTSHTKEPTLPRIQFVVLIYIPCVEIIHQNRRCVGIIVRIIRSFIVINNIHTLEREISKISNSHFVRHHCI